MRRGGTLGKVVIGVVLLFALVAAGWLYPMGARLPVAGAQPLVREIPASMPTTANAAEGYRKAITLLLALQANAEDRARLDRYIDGDVDAEVASFFGRHRDIASWVKAAVLARNVDWGERTMQQRLDDLSQLRGIANFTLAHARYAPPDPIVSDLLDDTLATMAMARHIGAEGVLTSKLVEIAIEMKSIDTLAAGLGGIEGEWLASLPNRLDRLPTSSTGKQVIAAEAALADVLVKQQNAGPAVDVMVAGLHEFYRELGEAIDTQAPDQFIKTVDSAKAKYPQNLFVQTNGSSLARVRGTLATIQIKRLMLRAAIDIRIKGEGALANWKDPGHEVPFAMSKSETGFTLTSKTADRAGPIKLVVGKK